MLDFKSFKSPTDLCNWVNEEEALINIFSICNDEFSEFVIFYTITDPEIETGGHHIAYGVWPMQISD